MKIVITEVDIIPQCDKCNKQLGFVNTIVKAKQLVREHTEICNSKHYSCIRNMPVELIEGD